MEGIRGWGPILPGVRWLYARSSANQRSAIGVGVSPRCGVVLIRGNTVSVGGSSKLYTYGRIAELGITILPRCGKTSTLARGGSLAAR